MQTEILSLILDSRPPGFNTGLDIFIIGWNQIQTSPSRPKELPWCCMCRNSPAIYTKCMNVILTLGLTAAVSRLRACELNLRCLLVWPTVQRACRQTAPIQQDARSVAVWFLLLLFFLENVRRHVVFKVDGLSSWVAGAVVGIRPSEGKEAEIYTTFLCQD